MAQKTGPTLGSQMPRLGNHQAHEQRTYHHNDPDNFGFFRGFAIATPIGLLCWAGFLYMVFR